jgi:hypothetical protein
LFLDFVFLMEILMQGLKSWVSFLAFLFLGSPVYALEAETTTAPHVPPYITRTMPETVVVKFEATEFVGPLADGKQYKFWSYNGTVPGPMIRVRQGDTVEFQLSNHLDSEFPHNIDIHAVNGPGGGAMNLVAPGEKKTFRFKTLHPGLFVYHCASPTPSVPAHISNGMYGLLLVEPKHGFSRVDHEFYVFESEFYTQNTDIEVLPEVLTEKETSESISTKIKSKALGAEDKVMGAETVKEEGFMDSFGDMFSDASSEPEQKQDQKDPLDSSKPDENSDEKDLLDSPEPEKNYILEFSYDKGLQEHPDFVVFNGRQGALLGENALKVKVGEKIRIFFGNIGPNGISSLRIIGEVFDRVYVEGSANGLVNRSVQTTLVPSAGATIVEFTIDVPGDYLIVDHSIFRMDKGAIGLISTVGEENPEIYESVK